MADLKALGRVVAARRAALEMTQTDVAIKASVSARSIHNLESGATWPQVANRERIEHALGWAPGSLEAIREGGEPVELAGDEPSQSTGIPFRDLPRPAAGSENVITDAALVESLRTIQRHAQGLSPDIAAVLAHTVAQADLESLPHRIEKLTFQELTIVSEMVDSLLRARGIERPAPKPMSMYTGDAKQVELRSDGTVVFGPDEDSGEPGEQPDDLAARRDSSSQGRGAGKRTDEMTDEELADLARTDETWAGYVDTRRETADEEI